MKILKISFMKIHSCIIALGIITLPMIHFLFIGNAADGKTVSRYILYIGLLAWMFEYFFFNRKIELPHAKSYYAFCFFLISIILSGVFNFSSIIANEGSRGVGWIVYLKGTIAMVSYFLISCYVYDFIMRYNGNTIKFFIKWLMVSFLVTGTFSILEFGSFANGPLLEIHQSFNDIFRNGSMNLFRLRSLTQEPSLFGNYFALIFPILFVGAMRRGKVYIFLLIYGLAMVLASFSRTAYAITLLELIILLLYMRYNPLKHWKALIFIVAGMVLITYYVIFEWFPNVDIFAVIESLSSLQSDGYSNSNMTRIGSAVGAFNIFLDYPLFGVGWNQAVLYVLDYYPDWAWQASDIKNYFVYSPTIFGSFPAILANTGIIGFLSWTFMWFFVIVDFHKVYAKAEDNNYRVYLPAFVVATIGIVISGLNWGVLEWPAYWVLMGISWAVSQKYLKEKNGNVAKDS